MWVGWGALGASSLNSYLLSRTSVLKEVPIVPLLLSWNWVGVGGGVCFLIPITLGREFDWLEERKGRSKAKDGGYFLVIRATTTPCLKKKIKRYCVIL